MGALILLLALPFAAACTGSKPSSSPDGVVAIKNGSAEPYYGVLAIEQGGTGATNASDARKNLGLGSAATQDVGTRPGNLLQLDSMGRLPAVDASQLVNVSQAMSFSGALNGDVVGTQNATVVSKVGGVLASAIASAVSAVGNATPSNIPSTLVQRDASGNFSAGTVSLTGDLGKVKNVSYSWPATQGAAATVLTNDGAGNLSWAAAGNPFLTGSRQLKIVSAPGSPYSTTTVNITAAEMILTTDTGNRLRVTSYSSALNIATTGAGGLDSGTVANSTWYYIWAIHDGTTASSLFSLSSTSPSLPAPYQYKLLLGAAVTDGSGRLIPFIQRGSKTLFVRAQRLLGGGAATSVTSVSLAAAVPPMAASASLQFYCSINASITAGNCALGVDSQLGLVTEEASYNATYAALYEQNTRVEVNFVTPQTVYYANANGGYNTPFASIDVLGFSME